MNCFVQSLSIFIPDTLDTMFHATGCSIRCVCKVPYEMLLLNADLYCLAFISKWFWYVSLVYLLP
uniref:Uncharacterized protein n=1 Tax=Aegilops tauschii subsp. strangulata TaxID=200361 RepID=A0A453I4S9_AEGTS